jgi:hypothetical protein
MATVIPKFGSEKVVAAMLLDIVGPGREAEVETGTGPFRFMIPEDVAVEYERRIRLPSEPAQVAESENKTTMRTRPGRQVGGRRG